MRLIYVQDDLEDCGEITCEVKLRVMPDFWFVLNRSGISAVFLMAFIDCR
jgi:hypothetical protein